MTAYFDLENLESYLAQPKNEAYDDSLKMIIKQLDLSFNFSKEEFKKSEALSQFSKTLTRGVGNKKINYIPEKFPPRPLTSDSHINFNVDDLLSAYFINDEAIEDLKVSEDLLIASVGEEMKLFKMLFLNNDDYAFDKKLLIGDEFSSWEDLNQFYSPFHDLIIVDNFILSDEENYHINLKNLIKNCLKENLVKKINVVIFIKTNNLKINPGQIKRELSELIQKHYTQLPNITIVMHKSEHDRTILKNYLRIYSGDSFNYFDRYGEKITTGREVHFVSIANKINYKLYKKLLEDLQQTIDDSHSRNIIGDKVSRFLTFK